MVHDESEEYGIDDDDDDDRDSGSDHHYSMPHHEPGDGIERVPASTVSVIETSSR